MKFTWDINKEKINIYKHGVNFEQASYVFSDPFALNLFDSEHSDDESRWILVGKSINETITIVVHTFENEHGIELVRIISARKANKNEKQIYHSRCPK